VPTPNSFAENQAIHDTDCPPNPAAGADYNIVKPSASQVQLLHLSFTLTTDANVATRLVWISLESAALAYPLGSSMTHQAAGTALRYIATQHPLLNMGPPPHFRYISLPEVRTLWPADTFKINIMNIQVGDQISDLRIHWKLWRGLT